VQRDYHILEEYNVLITEGYSESTDNGGQDIKEFSSPIEFVGLMNELIERLIDGFTDHLAAGH
jgi:hypothetical protein